MRYIDLDATLQSAPRYIIDDLKVVDSSMFTLSNDEKQKKASKGNDVWKPIKVYFEKATNRKCWYTESKNPGCLNDLEHYRPKGLVQNKDGTILHWYWFLAFNPINYRLSAHIPNRLNKNEVWGETGGKGNKFPLLKGSVHGDDLTKINSELPVLLDPCCESDVSLLEFLPDGRPVTSQKFSGDATAVQRVTESSLLLNLDYPTFNVDREKLYNKIRKLVTRGDRYFEEGNNALDDTKQDLRDLMIKDAEYSKAAECYIRCFRDRKWVEDLLY